jgi:hypothetical protein
MTQADVIRELHSDMCPCGERKVKKTAFCAGCWKLLPPHMQKSLYQKLGQGFERAYEQAKRCIVERRKTAKEVSAGRFSRIDYRK